MYGHDAIVRRISILAVALLAAGAIACGRTPAGSATGAVGSVVPNAEITEYEYAGQRAAPVIVPGSGAGTDNGRAVVDPNGPTLVP